MQHAKAAAEKGVQMLSTEEEQLFCQYFLKKLLEFCNVFEPRVPRSAVVCIHSLCSYGNYVLSILHHSYIIALFLQAIAAAYFKRFYLHTSVMEHNPRQIL